MIQILSSLRLTFVLLLSLAGLLGLGVVFSMFPDLKDGIKLMNESLIHHWFITIWPVSRILPIWFLFVVIISGLLFVNIFVCTITKQLTTALKVATPRRWSFFMMHFFFIVVLFCHGISLVTGHRVNDIQLYEGDIYRTDDLTIEVREITFRDNPDFLKLGPKKSRKLMTRKRFHRKDNFADIRVTQGDNVPVSGRIMMLSPVKSSAVRVTLTKFIHGKGEHQGEIGLSLTVTGNRFTRLFFTVYALMIVSLVCFIVITWAPQMKKVFSPPAPPRQQS